MADLTQFFSEIQRAEYFDFILARLSIEDLEKMTMQFEDQIKEIVTGEKYHCCRHKVFLYGSCEKYSNQSKLQLSNFDKFARYSNNQIKIMISFLQRTTEDQDYSLQVLLPELIELLLINIFTISKSLERYHGIIGVHSSPPT